MNLLIFIKLKALPKIKTSEEWLKTIPECFNLKIIDPDGWDRTNYQYSFFEEKILFREFYDRLGKSTIKVGTIFTYLYKRLEDEIIH